MKCLVCNNPIKDKALLNNTPIALCKQCIHDITGTRAKDKAVLQIDNDISMELKYIYWYIVSKI